MTSTAIKNRINNRINKLPKEKLEVIDDFVSYLFERDTENEATKELISIPGFEKRFKEALKNVANGELYDYEKIKKNV